MLTLLVALAVFVVSSALGYFVGRTDARTARLSTLHHWREEVGHLARALFDAGYSCPALRDEAPRFRLLYARAVKLEDAIRDTSL